MSFRRIWLSSFLLAGIFVHPVAVSALALQTPTGESDPEGQLEIVLGPVETLLSGHPRIVHGPAARIVKWGPAVVTYVLPARQAEPPADTSSVSVEARLAASGRQPAKRMAHKREPWAYRPSPMTYRPKHPWKSLRAPRYQPIRSANHRSKRSWSYTPPDFRYRPAQDKRRTVKDAEIIIQRYRDLGWSVEWMARNWSIDPAEVAAHAGEG